jgi:hypothetical protein
MELNKFVPSWAVDFPTHTEAWIDAPTYWDLLVIEWGFPEIFLSWNKSFLHLLLSSTDPAQLWIEALHGSVFIGHSLQNIV